MGSLPQDGKGSDAMDVEMEEVKVQQPQNPVVGDALYLKLRHNLQMLVAPRDRKEALGQICLRVMEKVHNVFGVQVANLCKKGRCPPKEFEIRLKYKRALLGAKGAFDYMADGSLKQALNT